MSQLWKKYLKQLSLPESYVSITLGFLVVIVAGLFVYNHFSRNKTEKPDNQENKLTETQPKETLGPLPLIHVVAANENLWKIAEKYYNSGYNWVTIVKENKLNSPNNILVGQKLSIPKAEPIIPETGKMLSTSTQLPEKYTVIKGDNLWKIAVKSYGDGYAWTKIAKENGLVNPNLIHAGNVLRMPR